MTEILFYHLQSQPLERVLPVLLEKCLERSWRVVVQAPGEERISALDDLLWTFGDSSFLPHGTARDGASENQPVFLTTADHNPNGAAVRVLVDGAEGPALAAYIRALILFDGNDDEMVAAARQRWAREREAGHALTYWQQDDAGRWQKRG